jgi:RHS repeat-associated protein
MAYANPHAVTQIANGLSTTTFAYDNNGNVVQKTLDGTTTTYVWDYANRLIGLGVGGATTTYGYDAFGARVLQTGTSTTTIYPFKWYSIASSTGTGAKYSTTTDYVFNGDTLVATVDQQMASGNATGTAKIRYIHPDHLGSTNVVTDENGALVQTLDYYPYGSTRVSVATSTNEKRRFIGQFTDDSALSYLNARYYDNGRGQFLSQDPVFVGDQKQQNLKDPQSLNSYSYANDNPISGKDPNGRAGEGAMADLSPTLEALGAMGLLGTSEFWGPAALITLGTGATVADIYNLYHNNSSGSPGFQEAAQLLSGNNGEGPINTNPKNPKWLKIAGSLVAGTSILGALMCGDLGSQKCIHLVQTEVNFFRNPETNENRQLSNSLPGTSTGNSGFGASINEAIKANQQVQTSGQSTTIGFGSGGLVLTPRLLPRSQNPTGHDKSGTPIYCWGYCGK